MGLLIPDDVLHAARMTEGELRQEVATLLFEREKLTLAQAADLAQMPRVQFQHLLASREIPIHYGVEEFDQDLHTLRELGQL